MTYAEAERTAREAAHALPEMDHASVRAIEAVAALLVEAYRRGAADQRGLGGGHGGNRGLWRGAG